MSDNVLHSSKSNEWYTPNLYIDLARAVMGNIELDPASSEEANKRIGANRYYTKQNSAFLYNWEAKTVWLNPPYGQYTGRFVRKLLRHYYDDDIEQAIILLNANPGRAYWRGLWEFPVCFTQHRIRFFDADGNQQDRPPHENAFIYLGPIVRWPTFYDVFKSQGVVVMNFEKVIDWPGGWLYDQYRPDFDDSDLP